MAERRDKFEAQHAKNRLLYEKQIKQIFTKVCYECGMSVTQLANIVESAGKDADFARIPAVRKVLDKLQKKLSDGLKATVVNGVKSEWKLANDKYDALIGTMVAGDLMEKWDEQQKARTFNRNMEALDAFLKRKEGGLDLSQRVWQYSGQMRDAMEVALELGISEGESAAEIARDLKQYLNYPDKLFRRVRDKETGELKLSKPASMFHPGQGVYRSSYKNALRLALNETNIAYRKSDSIRRVGLDFVVGIEIHLSNNHNCKGVPEGEFFDICDLLQGKYPPDFEFVGWHPNCYSDDSEVLTNRGWLLFRDVLPNDWILSLNPDTRIPEWTTIVATQSYRYAGRMVRFHNRSLDCLVTPEHRMVYLNKADGRIRYCEAKYYTKGKGGFYRGCEYSAEDINTITIGGTTFDFDAFCRFMGYWLADGACFNTSGITISQNDEEAAKPNIIEAVKALGYEPTVYPDSVRFYHSAFVRYLRRFGHCKDKYIPDEIKRASRRQIALFLDAFVECDGSIRPPKDFVGNRGTYFHGERGERVFFTTSRRMAGDLCELILKAGGRPSVREREPGASTKKDGTVIRSNYTCFVISDLKAVTATVFDKEFVDYDGMVYDLTLAKNHIMYIKRNGRCFWGSNCRCWTTSILQTEDEFFRDSDGKYRGSVNEVKDVPPQFKEWLEKNGDRIAVAEERGTLPYFLRDNRWAWQDEAARPNEKVEYKNTALDAAEKRHAARTEEQVKAIKDRWAIRQTAVRNTDRVTRLIDSVPGMREYLKGEVGSAMSILDGEKSFNGDYNLLNKVAVIVKNQMRHLRSSLDVLDNPWEVLKEHGVEKTRQAAEAVQKKMAQWSGQPLEYQLKKLKFEAQWIEDNKKGVLSTWKVAQDAYLKAARRVEWEIEWKPIVDELNTIAASPYADQDMVAEVRSYVGKDKDEAEYALSHLKIDTEKNELEDKFESLYRQAPGAFNDYFRKSWEDALAEAFDSDGIKELRMLVVTANAVITTYNDLVNKAAEKLAYVKDQKVADALSKAVAKQALSGLQDAIDLADREIKFQKYVAEAEKMLQQRDLLTKLKPQVIGWLEERSVPKDYSAEDIEKLKNAIQNAQFVIDEWEKKKQAYSDHFQYMQAENIKSKAYKDLVMELRQAILDIDVAKVDELLPKVDEQKAKHENEKAYWAGVAAEWEKMKGEIFAIRDEINKDLSGYFGKDGGRELIFLIADFEINEGGPRRLREARKQYKEILDLVGKLGINLTPFSSSYSQERKDKAVWDTKEKAEKEGRIVGQLADSILFDPASKAWLASMANDAKVDALKQKLANKEITQSEFDKEIKTRGLKVYTYVDDYGRNQYLTQREAIYEYTRHYCDKNEPLRNLRYENEQTVSHFYAKVNAITDIISTCLAPQDMWFQRGDDDLEALFGRLGFAGVTVPDEVRRNTYVPSDIADDFVASLQQFVGQICTDGGFLSLGSAKGQGMRKPVIVNVFVPKGTAIMYLEPFSAFGNGVCSASWDGKSRCRVFEGEFESLLQRGTQMRITKIYKGPDLRHKREVIYIDAEVVGQDVKDLSYVKNSNIGRGN